MLSMNKTLDTQTKRLDYLLTKFKEDSVKYQNLEVGDSQEEKRIALRSLMNIRMPRSLDEVTMVILNDYLKEDINEKGIVGLKEIKTIKEQYRSTHPFADKLSIWQGDITRLKVGAIVNAANSQMLGCFVPCHGCIDNAIHTAAGIELREECYRIMNLKRIRYGKQYEEPTGTAILTSAYNLSCDYVIHTVGPIVTGRLTDSLRQDLCNCYDSVLKCCLENNIRSVAFCCISTGEFHFPNDEAAKIATEIVCNFMREYNKNFDRVIFNVFKDYDRQLYEGLLS